MPDLTLDAAGDLDVSVSGFRLTDDASGETLRQRLATRLRLFAGEWFLDTRAGLDWYGRVLGKNPHPTDAEAALKTLILETPGVASLRRYSQAPASADRRLAIDFVVAGEDGQTVTVSEVF